MSAGRSCLVEDPLEDARGDERAGEREADLDLWATQRTLLGRRRRLRIRLLRRRGGRGIGARPDSGRRELRAAEPRRLGPRGLRAQPRGLLGVAARLLRLGRGLLGPLARLALLARQLLLGLLGRLHLLVRLRGLLLGAARGGLRDL